MLDKTREKTSYLLQEMEIRLAKIEAILQVDKEEGVPPEF